MKSQKALDLIRIRPTAFTLLALIAQRARWSEDEINLYGLEVGQALIGDHSSYGVSERIYRTDKQYLTASGIATFQGTNRGTIATLLDDSIFNINFGDERRANRQQSDDPTVIPETTNKEYKNTRREREGEKRTEKTNQSSTYLLNIPLEDIELIQRSVRVTEAQVRAKGEAMYDYCKSHGRKYKDYAAVLRNAVRKDFPLITEKDKSGFTNLDGFRL